MTETTKQPRSMSVALRSGDKETLRIVAVFKKDGTATTYVIHSVKDPKGKPQNTRGGTEQHPTADAAKKAVERLAKEAEKRGWKRGARRAGFQAKPDAFTVDNLPKPAVSSKRTRR